MVEAESSQEQQPGDMYNNAQQPSHLYEQDQDEDIVAPPSSFYSQIPFSS